MATIVLGTALSVSSAQAVPISGDIAFTEGAWTPKNAGGTSTSIPLATQIDFDNNATGLLITGSTGDFATAGINAGSTGTIKIFPSIHWEGECLPHSPLAGFHLLSKMFKLSFRTPSFPSFWFSLDLG